MTGGAKLVLFVCVGLVLIIFFSQNSVPLIDGMLVDGAYVVLHLHGPLECSSPDSRYGSRTRTTFLARPNSVLVLPQEYMAHIESPRPISPRLLPFTRPLLKKRPAAASACSSPTASHLPTAGQPLPVPASLPWCVSCREPPEASGPDAWAPSAPVPAPTSPAMAGQPPPPGGSEDDFLEHFFAFPSAASAAAAGGHGGAGAGGVHGGDHPFPLALSLDAAAEAKPDRDPVQLAGLFPPVFAGAGGVQQPHLRGPPPQQMFQAQPKPGEGGMAPQPPAPRPKVRARRGQATDPHSIAERLRRERIAERMRALQELVPNTNKTDRAAMLDEILDYVKFLRLQVKVLSMSRLGGAGAVAQLVADVPLSVKGEASDGGSTQHIWEKWSTDGTEKQVAKLMEEDIGAAMQFLQSKALCMMPISLAMAIYDTQHSQDGHSLKHEPNTSS